MKSQLLNFKNFLQRLSAAANVNTLDHCLNEALKSFGFNQFAYTYYGNDFSSNSTMHHEFVTQNLQAWHRHFHSQGYEHIDDIGKEVRDSLIPVTWDLKKDKLNGLLAKQMLHDALEFGLQKGLSIPLHGPQQSFAILVIQDNKIEEKIAADNELPSQLQRYAIYYQHYLRKLLLQQTNLKQKIELTKRELQCLKLAAESYDTRKIAEILKLKPRTVNFHFENIHKKLGTKSRLAAVQLAVKKEWVG